MLKTMAKARICFMAKTMLSAGTGWWEISRKDAISKLVFTVATSLGQDYAR